MTYRPDPTLVSVEAFARLSGALPGEVEELLRSGAVRRAAPGKVSLIEATRALIHHVKSGARDASLATAQADARDARAEATELALQIERRDLIVDDDAQAAIDHIVGQIVTITGSLPARATRDLSARAVINDTLREVQGQVAADLKSQIL